ncbi:DNA/RNA non-specific endonuclease [Gillisia sp. JM1]|uniref:DNA/RNA non-specific endonuclease n=1 Tax=Gillisia sp. JM1 TaxID=1283286 RepID=UPI0003F5A16F|nr:DNA/RNA non-specific endonuclease [Gillisia sp. JM1]
MKSFNIILLTILLLFSNEMKCQSGLLKPFLKEGEKEILSESIEYSAKKGGKEMLSETIEYSGKKGVINLAEYTLKNGSKEYVEKIAKRSSSSIFSKLSEKSIKVTSGLIPLKLINESNEKLIKKSFKAPIDKELSDFASKNVFKLIQNERSITVFSKENIFLGKIFKTGKHTVIEAHEIITKKYGGKERFYVNPILNSPRPNTSYKIGNTIYKTDYYSRTVSARISSFPKNIINRPQIKGVVNRNSKNDLLGLVSGDVRGHKIAHSLGGNSGKVNFFAQSGKLNNGSYSSIEGLLNKNKGFIKNYEVTSTYSGKSYRPKEIIQRFEFRGDVNKLITTKSKHPGFSYVKSVDVNGLKFYNCQIKHIN